MHLWSLDKIEKPLQDVQLEALVLQAAQFSLHFLQVLDSPSKKYPSEQIQVFPTKIEFKLQEVQELLLFPKHSEQELSHF